MKSHKNPLRYTENSLYPNEFECILLKRTPWASFKSSGKASGPQKTKHKNSLSQPLQTSVRILQSSDTEYEKFMYLMHISTN